MLSKNTLSKVHLENEARLTFDPDLATKSKEARSMLIFFLVAVLAGLLVNFIRSQPTAIADTINPPSHQGILADGVSKNR